MNKRHALVVAAGVIVVLALLIAAERSSRFSAVNRVVLAILRPVNTLVLNISGRVSNTKGYFASLEELQAENKKLKEENVALRQENVALTMSKTENERLRGLLSFSNKHPRYNFQPAKVIGRDVGDLKDTIVIDRGSDANLKLNMCVVTAAGLVGTVDAVFPTAARVMLVNSPHSRVGAMDLRGDSRIAGVVSGVVGRDGPLTMQDMPQDADILPGDTVVTSGFSGYHPQGFIIGNVEEVKIARGGLTKEATITPSVDFNRLEEVLVITNFDNFSSIFPQEEKKPAIPEEKKAVPSKDKKAETEQQNTEKGGSVQ